MGKAGAGIKHFFAPAGACSYHAGHCPIADGESTMSIDPLADLPAMSDEELAACAERAALLNTPAMLDRWARLPQ